jgi:hypothetical protein
VHEVFTKWLHLPETGSLDTALAAVAANRLEGDPLWMLLVAPPASGKTEMLDSLLGLPDMHPAATLTEAALLSGVPRKERSKDASGGLLRAMGGFGFLICKDFTSVLSMHRDLRTPLLAALREIYDGDWTRHVGADGGRTLPWHGKMALIGGVTPVIDAHHSVTAALGERFLLNRIPDIEPTKQALSALQHDGQEDTMRTELRAAVTSLFLDFRPSWFDLEEGIQNNLASLSTLVTRARSAVERDRYRRDIELVPGSERPGRLVRQLKRLYNGLLNIGLSREECWPLVCRVAMDCIPVLRCRALEHLRRAGTTTSQVATAISYPTTTVHRALEDLTAHGIAQRAKHGPADYWELSADARKWMTSANLPEMSGDGL